jgi:hypothetical protein
MQDWWANFPFHTDDPDVRHEAVGRFEDQYGPLTEQERLRALIRFSYPLKERLGISRVFEAPTDIGKEAALKLQEQLLDDSHYDLLLNETGMVETPAHDDEWPLCILLKNVLPKELLDAVRPIVRKDGSLSKIRGAQKLQDLSDKDYARLRSATDGTFGFNARGVRGGQVYPCRITHYSGALPRDFALMGVLARTVAESFKNSWVSTRWEAQFEKAGSTAPTWLIRTSEGITPFTTITCNRSWRTAAHVDKGDLKEGFGVMCCLGDFAGCHLVFPRYRVAVNYQEGDVLLANVHEVHGNTPLLNPDGSVPILDREPERLVCVFYYQEKMEQCELTIEKEHQYINKRERGESKKKTSKNKAKAARA